MEVVKLGLPKFNPSDKPNNQFSTTRIASDKPFRGNNLLQKQGTGRRFRTMMIIRGNIQAPKYCLNLKISSISLGFECFQQFSGNRQSCFSTKRLPDIWRQWSISIDDCIQRPCFRLPSIFTFLHIFSPFTFNQIPAQHDHIERLD